MVAAGQTLISNCPDDAQLRLEIDAGAQDDLKRSRSQFVVLIK